MNIFDSLPSIIWTSAAVAAVVSAVSNLVGLLINLHLSNIAKQKELVFGAAIDLAKDQRNLILELAKQSKHSDEVLLPDIYMVAEHYYSLNHIFEKGKLDPDMLKKVKKQAAAIVALKNQGITDPAILNAAASRTLDEPK